MRHGDEHERVALGHLPDHRKRADADAGARRADRDYPRGVEPGVKNPVRSGRKGDLQAKRKVLTPHTGDTENRRARHR
jgi:hypothetical protein